MLYPNTDGDDSMAAGASSEIYDYMGTQCRYGHMRRTMFTTKSAPKLQGRAAEIKDLETVMVKLWEKYGILNLAWQDDRVELPGPQENKNDMSLQAFLQDSEARPWELNIMVEFAFVSKAPLSNHCL